MAAVLLFVSMQMQGGKPRSITVSQFRDYVDEGQLVGKIDAYVDRIEGQNPEGMPGLDPKASLKFRVKFPVTQEYLDKLVDDLQVSARGVDVEFHTPSGWQQWAPQLLMTIGVLAVIYFFIIRRMGGGGGIGGFVRSKHKLINKEQVKVTFSDVAGIDEAKEEVAEIIEFLRNPKKFDCRLLKEFVKELGEDEMETFAGKHWPTRKRMDMRRGIEVGEMDRAMEIWRGSCGGIFV